MQWRTVRATVASAVLVVRSSEGRILMVNASPGSFQLPVKFLDGWQNITHQVDDFLRELVDYPASPSLVSVEGVCGAVTFLYRADIGSALSEGLSERWLPPDVAAAMLPPGDARLLSLCAAC
jgi:hypothetical protein